MEATAQLAQVEDLLARIQAKPWNPGVQAEYEAARQLRNELLREARQERR